MLNLYKTLVRLHLELCTPVWSSHYKKDKILQERVQCRFTRMIPELKYMEYESRLNRLGLWSWRTRKQGWSDRGFQDVCRIVDSEICPHTTAGAPKATTDKLQRVLNAAARLLSGTRKFDCGLSDIMHVDLHWLDVSERVTYKLVTMVHNCLHAKAPRYLTDYCTPVLPLGTIYVPPVVISYLTRDTISLPMAVGLFLLPGTLCVMNSVNRR